ncbi:hypothetical protein ASF86_18570 [Acinetobacter sp. Leaf130]|nr:hypothetical protein ASF86_18570 [Acinetobacter sp. Leaf130]
MEVRHAENYFKSACHRGFSDASNYYVFFPKPNEYKILLAEYACILYFAASHTWNFIIFRHNFCQCIFNVPPQVISNLFQTGELHRLYKIDLSN